eukprot:4615564-Prymnesium_polylepis.1
MEAMAKEIVAENAAAGHSGAPNAAAGTSGEKAPKRQKVRSDGAFKQSGLKEGDKRGVARTIYFKYEVAKYYRRMQALKEKGLCPNPGDVTCDHFGSGITNGQVSTWAKKEHELREALLHVNVVKGRGKRKHADGKLVPFTSRAARRCVLQKSVTRPYAAAEAEVHAIYREKRQKGLTVGPHFLRATMKKVVKKHYGSDAADTFKASRGWLRRFTNYYGMSLRRKSNKKHLSIEERLPKCKRWHARFRRRLMGGPKNKLDSKWGRWLPEDRISVDQVPCNLREGDGRTNADTGEKRIW